MKRGNIFTGLTAGTEERFDVLVGQPGCRIERIVSSGQASPPGFWYDQPQDEWVLLLSGTAGLRFEDEADVRQLGPGDWLLVPAHTRHRVEWTDATQPSVWLAVHFPPECRPASADFHIP
jgi:cupin 2 domain-containing protein